MDGLQFPQGLESLQGGSLLFTTKFPEILGTLFNYLGKMKGWVDLGATHWFWTQDLRIGNPAPQQLAFHKNFSFNKIFLFLIYLPLFKKRWGGFGIFYLQGLQ